MEQTPELIERCTPVQKQLLGVLVSPGRNPLGNTPHKSPCSFYWFTRPEDIPLLEWHEKLRAAGD